MIDGLDKVWLEKLDQYSVQSTCDRGRSSCIITSPSRQHMLSKGIILSPTGLPSCDEEGHLMVAVTYPDGSVGNHCYRTDHCERIAILNAYNEKFQLNGCVLYCTMTPCHICAGFISRTGACRFVSTYKYKNWSGDRGIEILKSSGIEVDIVNQDLMGYDPKAK